MDGWNWAHKTSSIIPWADADSWLNFPPPSPLARSNLIFFCLLVCAGCWRLCFPFSQHTFSPDTLFELTSLVLGPRLQVQQLVNVWQHLQIYICAGIRLRNCCSLNCSVGLFLLALFQMLVNTSSPPVWELIRRLPSKMTLSLLFMAPIFVFLLFSSFACFAAISNLRHTLVIG